MLHGRSKVQVYNGYCVPLLSYGFGIVEWTTAELAHFDVLTCKTMTSSNSHHPRSAVERLYLPCYMGGRGLFNIENMYQRRLVMFSRHLETSSDFLVKECFNLISQMSSSKSLLSKAAAFASDLKLTNISHFSAGQLKNSISSAQCLIPACVRNLFMESFFDHLSSKNIKTSRSFLWLKHSLHGVSESSIFAI